MCGIAGVLAPTATGGEEALRQRLDAMCAALAHRGPDDAGVWADGRAGVAFGHRRLAVIDLSASGAQPMLSASGRTVIVYNGECYGLEALRADVERHGPPLRGHSDTEVVLEACERLGLQRTLQRLVGMFAFALHDRQIGVTHLVRDRLGIKPLFVAGTAEGGIAFASETAALRRSGATSGRVDPAALTHLLTTGSIPGGRSIHAGVEQVAPGTVLTIGRDGCIEQAAWWSLDDVVRSASGSRRSGPVDLEQHADRIEQQLRVAVKERMVADVPLGAFLSGGIDSSLVVALMQEQTDVPVRTFSIGSSDPGYDETRFARHVAEHLGTEHTELVVTESEVVGLVPELLARADEPLGDPSYLPTWLVSRLAREHVTVALSGDGGDEVFGGYTRHVLAASGIGRLLGLPRIVKAPIAAGLWIVPPAAWDALAGLLPARRRPGRAGEQAQKAARALAARDVDELYAFLVSITGGAESLVPDQYAVRMVAPPGSELALSPAERMMFADTVGYLPDDVLAKVDRASMQHSLEVRVPLLDHRVVEAAWELPLEVRIAAGRSKVVLRRLLARRLPAALFERPKRGFAQPVGAWLRGPLRPWAEDLLASSALAAHGLVDVATVRRLWGEHCSGRHDHHAALWTVLSLQAWAGENDVVGAGAASGPTSRA